MTKWTPQDTDFFLSRISVVLHDLSKIQDGVLVKNPYMVRQYATDAKLALEDIQRQAIELQ